MALKKINTIETMATPTSSALDDGTVDAITNLRRQLTSNIIIRESLDGPATSKLRLQAGSGFAEQIDTHFPIYQTIKITFDDASVEFFRVRASESPQHDKDTDVEIESYWAQLGNRTLRVARVPGDYVDVGIAVTNITAQAALGLILNEDYNMPPFFTAGTVDASLASVVVAVESNGHTHLDCLYKLCEDLAQFNGGVPAELEFVWDDASNYYIVNVKTQIGLTAAEEAAGTPDPTLRPIDEPTGFAGESGARNRVEMTRHDSDQHYFTRIVPVGGPEDEPVTLARAAWEIGTIAFSAGASETTITLEDDPIPTGITLNALGSIYWGSDDNGFSLVDSFTAPDQIIISGDVTGTWAIGDKGRFATDSGGTELVYIDNSVATEEEDVVERFVSFPDIPPYENLLVEADVSGDMSDWSGGKPVGTDFAISRASGVPTLAQVSNPAYVRHGQYAVKVSCGTGSGIRTGSSFINYGGADIKMRPTDEHPWFSIYANIYVESGGVRLEFVDADGVVHPTGPEKAESTAKTLRALSVGGFEPAAGEGHVRIVATQPSTVFYVDAWTLTQSPTPWAFRERMGGRALWKAATDYMLTKSAEMEPRWSGELIDISHFNDEVSPEYAEIVLGSHCRLRSKYNADTMTWRFQKDLRVTELQYEYDIVTAKAYKRVQMSLPRPNAAERFVDRRGAAKPPEAPPVPGLATGASLAFETLTGRARWLPSNFAIEIKPDPPMSYSLRNRFALLTATYDDVLSTAAGKRTQGFYIPPHGVYADRFTLERHRAPDGDDNEIEVRWQIMLPAPGTWPTYGFVQDGIMGLYLCRSQVGDGYANSVDYVHDYSWPMLDAELSSAFGASDGYMSQGIVWDGVRQATIDGQFGADFDYDASTPPYVINSDTFTIMAVAEGMTSGEGYLFANGEPNTASPNSRASNYYLGFSGGNVIAGFQAVGGTNPEVSVAASSGWHTYAVRYDGSTLELFVDDMATPAASTSTSLTPAQSRDQNFVGGEGTFVLAYDGAMGLAVLNLVALTDGDLQNNANRAASIMADRGVTLP